MCQKILVIASEASGKDKNDDHHYLVELIKKIFGGKDKIKVSIFRPKDQEIKTLYQNNKFLEKSKSASVVVSAVGVIPELEKIHVL